ncbi:MAG: META domain-containing protein [Saprospiraceae bacterium]|nr:META domain-containing protein [Saprospiraceae bacterium]MDZ4703083.1 META domain-containing protein [Saprospiraceae bacterium]
MIRYLFLITGLLLNSLACKAPNSSDNDHTRLHDIWALQSMKQKDLPESAKGKPYIEIHVKEGKLMGNGGCNQLFGSIAFEGKNGLRISNLGSTKMACPELNVESEFMQLLQAVQTYELRELSLFMMGADGEELLKLKKVD